MEFHVKVEAGQKLRVCSGLHEVFENNISGTRNEIPLGEVQNHLLKCECRQHTKALQGTDSTAQLLEFDYRFYHSLSV